MAQVVDWLGARWWNALAGKWHLDRPGWRSFLISMAALSVALLLALYSGAAAETGRMWIGGLAALAAMAVAGWVALTQVPALARRTPLRWLAYQIDYKLTREGGIYVAGIFVVALAALNTGNNLLFMVLACLLAGIVVSGVFSRIALTGVEMELELPDHIFAAQPVPATVILRNEKAMLPSFSLRVVGEEKKSKARTAPASVLSVPVYFPYVPRQKAARQRVELVFPRRGTYRQDAFGIQTKFPFGFLQKTRRVQSPVEVLVYPRVEPTEEFYEILPLLSGWLESLQRGRGHDLYSIRDYQPSDSARHVDWKASAKTASLKVREFAREEERRVLLVLDPLLPEATSPAGTEQFERAVQLCACLAWHFYEIDAVLGFRCGGTSAGLAPARDVIYDILRELAIVEPRKDPSGDDLFAQLGESSHIFKIVLTSRARGSIPTNLWTSSYMIFMDSL